MQRLIVGAYPNDAAYEILRSEMDKIRASILKGRSRFYYPATTFVWSPGESHESKSPFWSVKTKRFALIFARWREAERTNDARSAREKAGEIIEKSCFTIERCGLTMGGEWDVYFVLVPRSPRYDYKKLKSEAKKVFHKLKRQFRSTRVLLCEEMLSSKKDRHLKENIRHKKLDHAGANSISTPI